jgi:hypothetical protein
MLTSCLVVLCAVGAVTGGGKSSQVEAGGWQGAAAGGCKSMAALLIKDRSPGTMGCGSQCRGCAGQSVTRCRTLCQLVMCPASVQFCPAAADTPRTGCLLRSTSQVRQGKKGSGRSSSTAQGPHAT